MRLESYVRQINLQATLNIGEYGKCELKFERARVCNRLATLNVVGNMRSFDHCTVLWTYRFLM